MEYSRITTLAADLLVNPGILHWASNRVDGVVWSIIHDKLRHPEPYNNIEVEEDSYLARFFVELKNLNQALRIEYKRYVQLIFLIDVMHDIRRRRVLTLEEYNMVNRGLVKLEEIRRRRLDNLTVVELDQAGAMQYNLRGGPLQRLAREAEPEAPPAPDVNTNAVPDLWE